MDCGKCEEYHDGEGTKLCLKCRKYLFFILKSNKRNPVIFEHLTEEIWDNIAAESNGKEIIDFIRQLPLEQSTPLMMQYFLNLNVNDIAKYLKTTRQTVYKKNKCSLKILKTWLK